MKRISKTFLVVLMTLIMLSLVSFSLTAFAQQELEKNKELVRRWAEVNNTGDLSQIDELLSADFVQHDLAFLSGDKTQGPEQMRNAMSKPAFSDAKIVIIDLIAERDKVTKFWSWSGTHDGDFVGIPPTGKKVKMEYCISLYRIENGKIAEIWMGWSAYSVMQQLGVIP